MEKKDKTKVGSYLTNFLTPSVIGVLKDVKNSLDVNGLTGLDKFAESANPFGALGFGALDIVSSFSDKVKNHAATRLAKFGGFAWYAGNVANDIVEIGTGNYSFFPDLFFDGLMTYQLYKDSRENYPGNLSAKKNDLVDDAKFWNWFKK